MGIKELFFKTYFLLVPEKIQVNRNRPEYINKPRI